MKWNLLSRRSGTAVLPTWSYEVGGLLWRMLFSSLGEIALESRDQEKRLTTFNCIDESTGSPLWERRQFVDSWWVGMEVVVGETLLLHGFSSPDMPEHRGLYAVTLESGAIKWQHTDLTFWFEHDSSVFAYRSLFDRRIVVQVDLHSGGTVREFADNLDEVQVIRQRALARQDTSQFVFPEIVERNRFDSRLMLLISKRVDKLPVAGNIECIHTRGLLVFNAYEEKQRQGDQMRLHNHLFVVDVRDGKPVFSDTINRDASAPAPDSFFVKTNRLFFVKDQRTLSAIELWKS